MSVNQDTLAEVVRQNQWKDNGLYPDTSVVPANYSWYAHGAGADSAPQFKGLLPNVPPATWMQVNAYTHAYRKKGSPVTVQGDKIYMSLIAAYVHKKTGGWIKAQSHGPIQGGFYIPAVGNQFPTGCVIVNRGDGVAEIDAPRAANHGVHVWPTPRGSFPAGTIDGLFVTMDMWVNQIDRRLVAMSSGDWYPNQGELSL